jgi:hypothetical protein
LRNGDVMGYQKPYAMNYINFSAPAGYQVTINYYKDVISQLSPMGINIIEIWNYDG